MFLNLVQRASPPLLAVMGSLCVALAGCGKKPSAPPPPKPEVYAARMNDPAYRKTLDQQVAGQHAIAKERNKVAAEMEKMVAAARQALKPGADEAAVKAELEGHPEKYPAWKADYAKVVELNAAIEKNLAETREVVRQRILQEERDRADVAAGKAVAKAVPARTTGPAAKNGGPAKAESGNVKK